MIEILTDRNFPIELEGVFRICSMQGLGTFGRCLSQEEIFNRRCGMYVSKTQIGNHDFSNNNSNFVLEKL
ncbi:hypothetical protein [Chlamydia felis Fe/C-56]|uniref:Uncharacterized protein n=1 Tax=Chlamydia felis (strain Fe/C-56) TaxID=264202 RepID=Q255P3_CHLFF|nr:hypothetical protein [Chlamydia felis Fe/C-56]